MRCPHDVLPSQPHCKHNLLPLQIDWAAKSEVFKLISSKFWLIPSEFEFSIGQLSWIHTSTKHRFGHSDLKWK